MNLNAELTSLIVRGFFALALGLIVGFQRERKDSATAGIRTFPLFALIGFFCALLGSWVVVAGLLGLSAVLVRTTEPKSGVTTEMAALVVFLIGAYLVKGAPEFAVISGGVVAILLHLKERMHAWVDRLEQGEVRAIMQFVLIAFVILPLLPDEAYDKFKVLNPREIWLMVVLITGISVASFSVQKFLGPRQGPLVSGALGGLISSTATTLSFARLSQRGKGASTVVPAILVATAVALVRMLVEIAVVAEADLMALSLPLLGLLVPLAVFTYVSYRKARASDGDDVGHEDPSQLRAAIVFGLLYALILYGASWARELYGDRGLYLVSVLSGLIDVDAITITTARLFDHQAISAEAGQRSILIAFLSNLVFKYLLLLPFAGRELRVQILRYFGGVFVVGLGLFFFL